MCVVTGGVYIYYMYVHVVLGHVSYYMYIHIMFVIRLTKTILLPTPLYMFLWEINPHVYTYYHTILYYSVI